MKKLLFVGLLAMPFWASGAAGITNSSYSKTNLDNMFLTNRIILTGSNGITVVSNTFKNWTIGAGGSLITELTNGSTTHPWIPPDIADVTSTNIICAYVVPTTGLYTVNFSEYTILSNNVAVAGIDSASFIYVRWTDPEISSNRSSILLNTLYYTHNPVTQYSPISFNCKGGTSLMVSNWSIDSWDTGDDYSTNYVRASIWGKSQ